MCGICGRLDFRGAPVARERIAAMCATLVHRGPDDEGIHVAPGIGLGQRRLSIIDLSAGAAPPLSNEDGTVWVVLNGEIYNFRELREGLRARGHVFRTASDTEVLVHLYEEHGTGCVGFLRGMFAFAIWDAARRELFAARDRFGKKPFFYACDAGRIVFASELEALVREPDVARVADMRAIDAYLTAQYVPSPRTAFEGINKLPAGHWLLCSATGELRIERYWSPPAPLPSTAAPEELEAELLDRFEQAVRIRMTADVPLGAFLSGGIDSGAVVALMARQSSRPITTFSVGFDDPEYDELAYARRVAARYATDHHEVVVRPDAAEVLPLLVRRYGEPFADSSAIPTYYISSVARELVTVALSGDGGDESFSGYARYATLLRWARADSIPAWARGSARALGTAVLRRLPAHRRLARIERGLDMLAAPLPERYALEMSTVKPQEKRALYAPAFHAACGATRPADVLRLEWRPAMDVQAWMMRHDQHYYLPDCLMVKVDIAAMANGLEVRSPLLDQELAGFAASIPSHLKRNGDGGKQIFRRAVAPLLPAETLSKPKTGFGVPLGRWFRTPRMAELLRGALLDDRARRRALFRTEALGRMVDEHMRGARDWSYRLWAILFLELWFREYID